MKEGGIKELLAILKQVFEEIKNKIPEKVKEPLKIYGAILVLAAVILCYHYYLSPSARRERRIDNLRYGVVFDNMREAKRAIKFRETGFLPDDF